MSSTDEDSDQLAELKAQYEAKMREAAKKKERKEREWRELKERKIWEEREKKEREEREEREVAETTRRLRDVYRAVAEKALHRVEAKARAETERVRQALTQTQAEGTHLRPASSRRQMKNRVGPGMRPEGLFLRR